MSEQDIGAWLGEASDAAVLDPLRPSRLLLVEDDEGDAFLVAELLRDVAPQWDLVHVTSLAAAKAALDETTWPCVLLDLNLPDTEGLSGLDAVLAAAPEAAVVVLTGLADDVAGARAVSSGAQDYLIKGSVDGPELARCIRYATERRAAQEASRRLAEAATRERENARLERALLPSPALTDPRVSSHARAWAGRHRSLLGGTFTDAVQADDGTVHAVIGEVAGYAEDTAALGVVLRVGWRALVLAGTDSARVLPALEKLVLHERRSAETHATLAVVTVSPGRDRMLVRLAGHPAPVLLTATGEADFVGEDATGPALGLLPHVVWDGVEVDLPRDVTLLMVTSGLLEGEPEPLGEEGLLTLLRGTQIGTPDVLALASLVDQLADGVWGLSAGAVEDDVAVLALGIR